MTDTRHQRTAREEAIAHIQAVRDFWWPNPTTPGMELDDIPTDTLRRLADERTMADARPQRLEDLRDPDITPAEAEAFERAINEVRGR